MIGVFYMRWIPEGAVKAIFEDVELMAYVWRLGQAQFLEQFKSSLGALTQMWFSAWFANLVPVFTDASFAALLNHTYYFVWFIYSK